MRKVDLTGQRFGRLTVLYETDPHISPSRPHVRFLCACDCGARIKVMARHLVSGRVKSCGCYKRDNPPVITHGHTRGRRATSMYAAWLSMIRRCQEPKAKAYKDYGGRGIKVCDRWRESFENFLADMGEKPKGTSLDRINNNGNYEPGNCRWATLKQQANNRRANVFIEHEGKKFTMAELARTYKIEYEKFRWMYRHKGLTVNQIIREVRNDVM